MADRVAVINNGEIILVEEKTELMRKLGKKQLTLQLHAPLAAVPAALATSARAARGRRRSSPIPTIRRAERTGIAGAACGDSREPGIGFKDLQTTQSSLEEIFVSLVQETPHELARGRRDLHLRDGAHVAHDRAEHRSRPCSRRRCTSWCSAPRSARASTRSTA